MTKPNITNTAASVKQRLLNRARAQKEDFNLLLTKYALERVLYRISQSPYKDIFVLKGALLFELNAHSHTTLVLVTHERGLASRCQRTLQMEAGRVL